MRIAVGQLWQETNTFNPIPTTRRDFEDFGVVRGPELIERMADTNELGGFIQSLRRWPSPPDLVGLVRLPAWPGGTATAETFAWLRGEMLAALDAAGHCDAILLALHGALVAADEPNVEGAILQEICERIGPRVPLVCTLDLHANITRRMVAHADALVLYHTAPHIDVFETGQRAAEVLRRILFTGARPATAFRKLPLVLPPERANTQDPTSVSYALHEEMVSLERQPSVLAAGLATVQPWLDIPDLGSSVVVVTDGDQRAADALAEQLAKRLWHVRREYLAELTSVDEAVRRAHERHREGLIVLSDCADATTSGAPGDSTWLLAELIKYCWARPALVTLVSPEVVAACGRLGPGAVHPGPLGGVRDSRFSKPLAQQTRIERLFDARFVMSGHLARNMPIDMGPSALLSHGDVRIVVTSRSGPHFAPDLFRAAGLDPLAAGVLIAKSPCGFRAAYAPHAHEIMVVRAPGCAPPDFWKYDYRRIHRPLWPFDEETPFA